jgi:hypothetical protein
LLDDVRKVLRLHHDSIHTERSYVEWIRRFVRFHGMRSREDLFPAEPQIETFLTDLAVHGNVAAATQNVAMHALAFLYKRVLNQELPGRIHAVRAAKKVTVAAVISLMEGSGARAWRGVPAPCADLLEVGAGGGSIARIVPGRNPGRHAMEAAGRSSP